MSRRKKNAEEEWENHERWPVPMPTLLPRCLLFPW